MGDSGEELINREGHDRYSIWNRFYGVKDYIGLPKFLSGSKNGENIYKDNTYHQDNNYHQDKELFDDVVQKAEVKSGIDNETYQETVSLLVNTDDNEKHTLDSSELELMKKTLFCKGFLYGLGLGLVLLIILTVVFSFLFFYKQN